MLTTTSDEFAVQAAAYLLQQAVEKLIKFLYMLEGLQYTKTHDIGKLLDKMYFYSKYFDEESFVRLREKAPLLTEWESRARYDESYMVNYLFVKINIDFLKPIFERVEQKIREQSSSATAEHTVDEIDNRYNGSGLKPMDFKRRND